MKYVWLVAISCLLGAVHTATAATYYVGTCKPKSYASISAAVNDPSVPAGSTIDICPGAYQEQVIISKSLTLTGLATPNTNDVQIVGSPSDQTVTGVVLQIPVRPTIWVTSGVVNLNNIDIEQQYTAACPQTLNVTGVYYASESSGTINHSNITLTNHSTCSISSIGVFAENGGLDSETVKIENSTIQAYYGVFAYSGQPSGFAPVLALTATGNQIYSLVDGFWLSQLFATASGNFVDAGANVFLLQAGTTNVTISGNTMNGESGVILGGAGPSITGNKIRARDGIIFNCHAATVHGNTIIGTETSSGWYAAPAGQAGVDTFYHVTYQHNGAC
jgi:hypothetical protein